MEIVAYDSKSLWRASTVIQFQYSRVLGTPFAISYSLVKSPVSLSFV